MKAILRKFFLLISIIFLVILGGTYGYMKIEHYNFWDAVYITFVSLTTVGYSEVVRLSTAGRLFTIGVIICGVTVFVWALGVLTSLIAEGQILKHLKGVKMKKYISTLENHHIIVGYGRIGEILVNHFVQKKVPFVVIEKDPDRINLFLAKNSSCDKNYILGDATDDQILIDAGIERASTFIPVLPTDAENLFLTMSARYLNPNIKIITRTLDSKNYEKLKKAGATRILSPHEITAERIFSITTDSNIVNFIDLMENYDNTSNLKLLKVKIEATSELIGQTLIDAKIPQKTGLVLMGIARGKELFLNPKPTFNFKENDEVISIGQPEEIKLLQQICK